MGPRDGLVLRMGRILVEIGNSSLNLAIQTISVEPGPDADLLATSLVFVVMIVALYILFRTPSIDKECWKFMREMCKRGKKK
jgi:hypothetical protein